MRRYSSITGGLLRVSLDLIIVSLVLFALLPAKNSLRLKPPVRTIRYRRPRMSHARLRSFIRSPIRRSPVRSSTSFPPAQPGSTNLPLYRHIATGVPPFSPNSTFKTAAGCRKSGS